MRKMQEEEFNLLTFDTNPKDCNHPEIVKTYYLGTDTGYACLVCGLTHTSKDVFDKPGLEGYK